MYWLFQVATIAAVNELLSETLNDLNDEELHEFKRFLQSIVVLKDLPDISWSSGSSADREEILGEMVRTYGRQSLELTREVFMDMKRTDLVQRLSKPSSGGKNKEEEKQKTVTSQNHVYLINGFNIYYNL